MWVGKVRGGIDFRYAPSLADYRALEEIEA